MNDTTQQETALNEEIKFLKEELEAATKTGSKWWNYFVSGSDNVKLVTLTP